MNFKLKHLAAKVKRKARKEVLLLQNNPRLRKMYERRNELLCKDMTPAEKLEADQLDEKLFPSWKITKRARYTLKRILMKEVQP